VQIEQEEHRRRVRRADDRADENALDPTKAEEQPRREAGQQSGQRDAYGRQQQRRPGGRAEVPELGAQPAICARARAQAKVAAGDQALADRDQPRAARSTSRDTLLTYSYHRVWRP